MVHIVSLFLTMYKGYAFLILVTVLTFLSNTILNLAIDQSYNRTIFIGWIIYYIQLASYIITVLKNPGIPTYQMSILNNTSKDQSKTCNICQIIIVPNTKTHHCKECNICIIGYDHHCPWTSKCIGKDNLKEFYIFLSSTVILFIYLIYAVSFSKLTPR